jgi:hypothetical protein
MSRPPSNPDGGEVAALVAELRDLLTPKLVAYIANVGNTRTTRTWANGTAAPAPEVEERLRDALHAARPIVAAYGPDTAQAWMQGTDPAFEDRAPAWVLRNGDAAQRRAVIVAGRRFAAP